jgi:hypothetical protein
MSKWVTVPAKLVAAFDASGKESSSCLVVAGFLSSQEDWKSFDAAWTKRLKADGLDYFHMVEFAASKKQFAQGWKDNEERRRRLLGDLVGIIKSHVYRKFASVVIMNSWNKLSDQNKRDYSLNAYVLAARSCAARVREWLEAESYTSPTGYAFEDGDEGKGLLDKRFVEDNLPRPVFKPKKDTVRLDGTIERGYTPLQAADIFAYELQKPTVSVLAGKPRLPKFRWGLEELLRIPGEPGYYSPKNVEDLNAKLQALSNSRVVDNSA